MIRLFLFLVFLIGSAPIFAQCPVANTCTPGAAPTSAHVFGMGIYNVAVGAGSTGFTNPTTAGASDGYQDYSCLKQATVLEGVATAITVTTNSNVNENVRVWVDLNNNGTFEAASELVFSSNNAKSHSGTFTIPVSASVIKNTVLRMRVSADDIASPIPTPCSTPAYSQVEDYAITVVHNFNKPAVDFSVNNPVTCSPMVQFTNLVQNGATSYIWRFSDGTTSTLANPSKTFAAPGTYSVTLLACNANGCDSLTKTNYVTYHTNVPVAANCTPATASYCCGYGITKVTFHTMVNSSQNGTVGYENFTCSKSVTVEEGQTYQLALETSTTNTQDTWAFIDYNNNGIFESSELIFTKLNTINPGGNITIAWGAVYNTPLRMRIISDAQGGTGNPCNNLISGQAEDYTITVTPNTRKPVANFTTSFTSTCDSAIQFFDSSQYRATSWTWDFGDGSPVVTTQNPLHRYTSTGTYTIKLKACNNIGCDSITKVNYVSVTRPCITYCPFVSNNSNNHHIRNVKLNTINNTTGYEPAHYGNYSNLATSLIQGNTYPIEITTANYLAQTSCTMSVFADFNQDGDFYDYNEKFFTNLKSNYVFTLNLAIPNNAKLGITRLRIIASASCSPPSDACNPQFQADYEVEDYSLLILPNTLPPVTQFYTPKTTSCSFTAAFADTSANGPTSWQWNFGDPNSGVNNTSSLQNPSHTFSAPGTYTITLTTCKGTTCNTAVKTNYITITGNTGPRTFACITDSFYRNLHNSGILFNSILFGPFTQSGSHGNPFNTQTYSDFSCSNQITLASGRNYPLAIDTKYGANLKGWIDYNDDGIFDPVSELIIASSAINHYTFFRPPSTMVTNKPLRLRFAADVPTFVAPEPCKQLFNGSIIDYSVVFTGPTGLEKDLLAQQLKVYPNPSNGTFSLEIPEELKGDCRLEVQSLVGQTVAKKALKVTDPNVQQVDLKHLPKGVYLLKLFNEKSVAVKKIAIE